MSSQSRRAQLDRLPVGESVVFVAPNGMTKMMRSIVVDFPRIKGKRFSQTGIYGLIPKTRDVIDLVMVTRLEDEDE